MTGARRVRPSQTKAFRVAAFAAGVVIFITSYWLGNRYHGPSLPALQALLLHPAQPLPQVSLVAVGPAPARILGKAIDDWMLLQLPAPDAQRVRLLASSHNRLAENPKLQGHFRVWIFEESGQPLPDFITQQTLAEGGLDQLRQALGLGAGAQGLFLINPQGQLQAVFTGIDSPATIAHDFQAILDQYRP